MTRRRMLMRAPAGLAVGLVLVVGAGACGRGEEPSAGPSMLPTITVSAEPSTETPESEPEPPLATSSVVIVRELPSGDRRLVAYDFATGKTRTLVRLSYDENPAVSPDGTQVVVERSNGPGRDEGTHEWLAESGSHLVLIDLVTGDERALTPIGPQSWATDPQWNRADGQVYYLSLSGRFRAQTSLQRTDPATGDIGPVPRGQDVSRYELESDGRHAWVYAPWKGGGAWRLDLSTGQARPHRFEPAVGGDLEWTPAGDWIAITQNVEGGVLSVGRWPDGWSPPPNGAWPARSIYPKKSQWPRFVTTFGDLGWEPDGSHVVLGSRRGVVEDRRVFPTTFDRWYVSLIDRRSGERTDITPPGAADTSFDVWWP